MALNRRPITLIQVFSEDWLPHSSLFTNTHSRGFISESGVVFNFVQRVYKGQELLNHSEMIKASRKYRSVIHSWYIKILDDMDDKCLTNDDKQELLEQSKILHKIEIAWHLCEILYINVSSSGTLLIQLLNWIKWHFTYYVELADQMIVSDLPQMHPHYWDIIMFFALRGDMEHASLFLELHSEYKIDPAFSVIRDLLKKFPLINNAVVIHEYYLRWEFWHENVQQTIVEKLIPQTQKRSHVQLNLLLNLLAGDLESFKQVSYLFHSWYQMMVSYALFTDPCLKNDIDLLIEKFIHVYYSTKSQQQQQQMDNNTNNNINENQLTMFDQLIRSAFNYDLIEVIKQSSMCFDDAWWFVTHFVDLIFNSSRYEDYQIADIGLIRDSFVLNYANSLFSKRKQFWQLSIEYLIHCKEPRQNILVCLERVPFESEHELQRLLATCRRLEFHDLEYSLCRIEARKWLRKSSSNREDCEKKYGSALFWAIRAKDKMLINHIVDQFLRQYLWQKSQTNNDNVDDDDHARPLLLLNDDTIANIGGSIVLSERLIFLCKYHEFHQLKRNKHYGQASRILVDMLQSNAIPDFFQFQVIEDCLPLIQAKHKPFMDVEQTCRIISSLEQLLLRIKRKNYHSNSSIKLSSSSSTTTNRNPLWNDYFSSPSSSSTPDPVDNHHHQLSLTYQNKIEMFENKLRSAAAHNLALNFVRVQFENDPNDNDNDSNNFI